MQPKERRDSGQADMFRARLDQIVDMNHALAKLGRQIDWRFLEERFGAVYSDKAGHPPLQAERPNPPGSCNAQNSSGQPARAR